MLERFLWSIGLHTRRIREWIEAHERRIADVERRIDDRAKVVPTADLPKHLETVNATAAQLSEIKGEVVLLEREVEEVKRMLLRADTERADIVSKMTRLEGVVMEANRTSSEWANTIFAAVQTSTKEIKESVAAAFREIQVGVNAAHDRITRHEGVVQDVRDRLDGLKR